MQFPAARRITQLLTLRKFAKMMANGVVRFGGKWPEAVGPAEVSTGFCFFLILAIRHFIPVQARVVARRGANYAIVKL